MSRKNCRMTVEERAEHDLAVSLRKMTDKQLCDYMSSQFERGRELGVALARQEQEMSAKRAAFDSDAVKHFIAYLEGRVGSGNGIGGGTVYRLRKELENAVADGAFGGT